jgi:hypothetical protein
VTPFDFVIAGVKELFAKSALLLLGEKARAGKPDCHVLIAVKPLPGGAASIATVPLVTDWSTTGVAE